MSQFPANYLVKPPMSRASAVHSIFRKSGIQAGRRRVTGGLIMRRLLPIRLRSQLAGARAGHGRRTPTVDCRIIRCRPADDAIRSPAPPKSPARAAPRFADREVTYKRSAFPARRWCPPQRSARHGSPFRRSFYRPSTPPKPSGFWTSLCHNALQFER